MSEYLQPSEITPIFNSENFNYQNEMISYKIGDNRYLLKYAGEYVLNGVVSSTVGVIDNIACSGNIAIGDNLIIGEDLTVTGDLKCLDTIYSNSIIYNNTELSTTFASF